MPYNIHPLFVHFPIALLFLYSSIKILPLDRWFPPVAWTHIERALLLVGVLGAFVALITGDSAAHLTNPNRQLVNMHALFAQISTALYSLLVVAEFLPIRIPLSIPKLLAVLGLIAISVTGLLGGVMVYGLSTDPFAGIIIKLLGITL